MSKMVKGPVDLHMSIELCQGDSFACVLVLQVELVQLCIEAGDLKQAVLAAKEFSLLESHYPTLERDYRRHSICKLAAKQQWAVAAGLAADDTVLQV